ncbi:uncharacterized protein [Apostichopus japonicus]|uniref:uncharacterized protein isoform X1 n=1 Tax=Stichopus japonicus TaxID=307972 RepID=UPI003AB6D81D
MTSMLPFLETDDSLLICSICLNELKEPKLLSCLHRYCGSCLMGLIDGNDNELQCPDCGIVHALPENGVEGLLVDISMKNILQLHRIKKAIDTRMKCMSCRNIKNAGAFCFNCDDFICQNCFDNHGATSKSRHHTLAMNDVKTGQLNNANWAALTDISRCRDHPENMLELCCRTCHGNHLMCRECSLVEHANHELCNDVPYLASEERNRINQKMDNLLKNIERVQKKRALMTKSTEKFKHVVERRKSHIQNEFDRMEEIIKGKIHNEVDKLNRGMVQMEDVLSLGKISTDKPSLKKQVKELNEEYDRICEKEKKELETAFQALQAENNQEQGKLFDQLANLKIAFKRIVSEIEINARRNQEEMKAILDFWDSIDSRLNNIQATVSAHLTIRNDWADIQCIPMMCSVVDSLMRDMDREIPDFKLLSQIRITKFENCDRKSHVDISEVADDEVDVDGIHSKQWGINGITGNEEGTIVVTGESSQDHSHITVIDLKGTTLRQDEIESELAFECRYCDFMTKFKVVTVCWNNEIGLYDIRDGTYTEMNLKDNDSVWPFGQDVSCVTVDEANNDIFIGYKDSRDISVFDDQLNYSHALSLPSTVRWPRDIAVHGNNLIVCDRTGMEAYAISITGSTCMVMFQFAKPNTKSSNCWPIGVCTDQNEFIYMLWSAVTMSSFKRLLVQYSRDGQRLLATRHVHDDALCISTVSTRRGETLLVSTWKTGKIFQYNLT